MAERLVDGLFPCSEDGGRDAELRAAIHAKLAAGLEEKALQSSPHIVLADKNFYEPNLGPVLADWLLPMLHERLTHRPLLYRTITV